MRTCWQVGMPSDPVAKLPGSQAYRENRTVLEGVASANQTPFLGALALADASLV